jgi:hypothetical protein
MLFQGIKGGKNSSKKEATVKKILHHTNNLFVAVVVEVVFPMMYLGY